jgi:glycosyltransferase involved in cell wall biosynthesis
MLAARFLAASSIAHINITGRGSTIRKIVLATVARCIGLPYLLHVHDYDYAEDFRRRGRTMQRVIAGIFKSAASVVVLGERDRAQLSSLFELPSERVTVLHNAVPDPGFRLDKTRGPGDPCELLFLGRLSARKGVPELLQALASPSLASRQWRATLAGGGPVEEFRELAERPGILERVCFPGWVDEAGVQTLIAKADILVLPSHGEGLAMAVLEGMSHGLAVIATPVGAHPEVIERGVSGLLVAPGDVPALAESIALLIDDGDLRRRLGLGARNRFVEKFEVRAYADRLARIHANLLSRPQGAQEPVATGKLS